MDAPCAGEDEPLSFIAGAGAPRASFAETGGGGYRAEDSGDDAADFHEDHDRWGEWWQDGWCRKGNVDAGDLGDDPGRAGSAEGHQRVAVSRRHKAARRGIP